MIITVSDRGSVLTMSEPLMPGLNVRGHVNGIINPSTLLVESWDPLPEDMAGLTDAQAVYLNGTPSFWRMENGRLVYAAPDVTGVHDVFHARCQDGTVIVSDDFLEMVHRLHLWSWDYDALRFFIRHGYFRGDLTYINEVRRVPAGKCLRFGKNGMTLEWLLDKYTSGVAIPLARTYEEFKGVFDSVCCTEKPRQHDALLLSGGWDSALLASHMKRKSDVSIPCVTFLYSPERESNQADVDTASNLTKALGIAHHIEEVDLRELPLQMLEDLVVRMPMAAHFSLNILAGLRHLSQKGFRRVWCGQNADSIYNLGPTSRLGRGKGKMDLIKRFYLSVPFWTTLPDVEKTRVSLAARLAAPIGKHLAALHYKDRSFTVPGNVTELLSAFGCTNDYLALMDASAQPLKPQPIPLALQEVRERLFDEKLSSFLVGGDSRVMHYAPLTQHLDSIMPFRTPALIYYFRGLQLGWRDVFFPKRYIRSYNKELLGNRLYREVYGIMSANRKYQGLGLKPWQHAMLTETCFSHEVRAALHELPPGILQLGCEDNLKHVISLFWISCVMRRMPSTALTKSPPTAPNMNALTK